MKKIEDYFEKLGIKGKTAEGNNLLEKACSLVKGEKVESFWDNTKELLKVIGDDMFTLPDPSDEKKVCKDNLEKVVFINTEIDDESLVNSISPTASSDIEWLIKDVEEEAVSWGNDEDDWDDDDDWEDDDEDFDDDCCDDSGDYYDYSEPDKVFVERLFFEYHNDVIVGYISSVRDLLIVRILEDEKDGKDSTKYKKLLSDLKDIFTTPAQNA